MLVVGEQGWDGGPVRPDKGPQRDQQPRQQEEEAHQIPQGQDQEASA